MTGKKSTGSKRKAHLRHLANVKRKSSPDHDLFSQGLILGSSVIEDVEDEKEKNTIGAKVGKKVKEIISTLKSSHSKFVDSEFGPNGCGEYGENSLYGIGQPDPAGSKYPSPDTLRWERPQYEDKKFQSG